jgi:hypothetical protein
MWIQPPQKRNFPENQRCSLEELNDLLDRYNTALEQAGRK